MRIGINWSSPRRLPVVRSLLAKGRASFCEVLIDNFLHVNPDDFASLFPGTPLSFHIMNSCFIQRDEAELRSLARSLRSFVETLKPLYVSDHFALFSHENRQLPMPVEVDYEGGFDSVRERVELWQELLGVPLLLENFPSILPAGSSQPKFLSSLCQKTGAGVLFDVSNAVVAHKNTGLPLAAWSDIVSSARHLHAAGYTLSDTRPVIMRDSHDSPLASDTLSFLGQCLRQNPAIESLVVERDANIEEDAWSRDLEAVQASLPCTTTA